MTPGEAVEFEAHAHAADAVAVRRLDEAAKDATRQVPGLDAYRDRLARLTSRH
jgi:gamma-butyrobetaine dioxygenase